MDKSGIPTSYGKLALSLAISLAVMFVLTMAFVNVRSDFYVNLSNFYMAVLMVAPMGIIMILIMWSMFPNRTVNLGLIAGFVALFAAAWFLGRSQTGVGNEQFLRAMIPHHSRAILVCENASITDPGIADLCDQIIASQQEEIGIMKRMLDER